MDLKELSITELLELLVERTTEFIALVKANALPAYIKEAILRLRAIQNELDVRNQNNSANKWAALLWYQSLYVQLVDSCLKPGYQTSDSTEIVQNQWEFKANLYIAQIANFYRTVGRIRRLDLPVIFDALNYVVIWKRKYTLAYYGFEPFSDRFVILMV